MTWVKHTWCLEGVCCAAEAYVENGSLADTQLQRHFDSTRDVEADGPPTREPERLMKGWIRFG